MKSGKASINSDDDGDDLAHRRAGQKTPLLGETGDDDNQDYGSSSTPRVNNNNNNNDNDLPPSRLPYSPNMQDNLYHKIKYYRRLQSPEMGRPDAGSMGRGSLDADEEIGLVTDEDDFEDDDVGNDNGRIGRRDHQRRRQLRLANAKLLEPPSHVLPAELFIILQNNGDDAAGKASAKQSSLTTIFSIWNTMVGSTLLSIPWGYSQAGLVLGAASVLFTGAISAYTAFLVVKHGQSVSEDFIQTCEHYLGSKGRYAAWFSSVSILVGATVAYAILMADSFFEIVDAFGYFAVGENTSEQSGSGWSYTVATLTILLAVFPLVNLKQLGILLRINSYGIISVLYMLFFIIGQSIYHMLSDDDGDNSGSGSASINHYNNNNNNNNNNKFKTNNNNNDKSGYDLTSTSVGSFMGILTVSFFSHSLVQTILKNNAVQENNTRDMLWAYLAVGLCYGVPGAIAYVAYGNDVEQNFLANDGLDHNVAALIARVLLLLQLLTVFPTLLYVIRIQFYSVVAPREPGEEYGWSHIVGLNVVMIAICVAFALYYPNIGDVLRYVGAICGGMLVFVIPVFIEFSAKILGGEKLTTASLVGHTAILFVGFVSLALQFIVVE